VQKGTYDDLIVEADRMLGAFELTDDQRKLELAFILNAYHGLRLVERFDAFVSVEEHTDLADDVPGAIRYARRYHAICPQRFFVKIPLSPAGILATRRAAAEGVLVNHTLSFSARQNYVVARLARPAFVNVFLGRLNSFVADNHLGDGTYVGERATLASQASVRELRERSGIPTRQIGASFREGRQVRLLAGMDVMTIPPKVAQGFLDLGLSPDELADKTGEDYQPPLNDDVDPAAVGLNTLWDIDEKLVAAVDELEKQDLDSMAPSQLVEFMRRRGYGDLLVDWTDAQHRTSAEEGKIPRLDNWREALAAGKVGLDALMNLGGFHSFEADQRRMDRRVRDVLGG